jgi:hypothetical protein
MTLASIAGTPVRLCVYDASGVDHAIAAVATDTGSTCAGKPCWRDVGAPPTGIRYRNKEVGAGAISVARLHARRGMLGLLLKAHGPVTGWSRLPATPPVTAQLIVGDGAEPPCWNATLATVHRSDAATLKITQP